MFKLIVFCAAFFLLVSPKTASPNFIPLSQQLLNNKLLSAVSLANKEQVALFLKKGASPRNRRMNDSPLYKAVKQGNFDMVSLLLKYHKTEIEPDRFNTLLTVAIRQKSWAITDLLFKHGKRIAIYHATLLAGASSGNEEVFKRLQATGTTLVQRVDIKSCLLNDAIEGNNSAIVAAFIKAGITPDKGCDSLTLAVGFANLEMVKQLVQANAKIDGVIARWSDNRLSPLQHAIKAGHFSIVEYLLESGAKLRRKNEDDKPLALAARQGHAGILEYLLDRDSHPVDFSQLVMEASGNGHLEVLRLLKKRGVNYQTIKLHPGLYPDGRRGNKGKKITTTALHFAANRGHLDVVRFLLEQGQGVDALETSESTPKVSRTALHYAAARGHYLCIDMLLKKGADINHLDPEKGTALLLASKNGYLGVVQLLIGKGAKYQIRGMPRLPLHAAAKAANLPVVDFLLNVSWKKEAKFALDGRDKENKTALHIASEYGHAAIVERLLGQGANPNIADKQGDTALHLSAFKHDVYTSLLKRQQQINVTNERGSTPLARAIIQRDGFYAAKLLAKRANIHLKNNKQQTLLHLISQFLTTNNSYQPPTYRSDLKLKLQPEQHLLLMTGNDFAPRVEWLIQHGIDIDAIDADGNTALHYLVDTNDGNEFIKRLLKQQPKLNILNKQKKTPLYIAVEKHQVEYATLLLKAGANPDIGTVSGKTPLYVAIQQGNTALVKVLLEHGANPNVQDNSGKNTLFAVVDSQASIEVIDLLVKAGIAINTPDKQGNNIVQALADSISKDAALPRLKTLLELGANPNVHNQHLETPLHHAVLSHAPKTAVILLENKANPNVQDKDGVTPLHYAVRTHAFKQLKQLLKYRAGSNVYNRFGKTPIHLAVEQNDANMLNVLLAAGGTIFSMDKDLRTPLITAVALDYEQISQQLINLGANLHVSSKGGWQALHFAVDNGNLALCKALLEKGANPHSKIWRGDSAITLAKQAKQAKGKNQQAIVELLESHKMAIPNSLADALANQDTESVTQYLQQSVAINSQSASGQSVLHLAIEALDVDAVQQLLQRKADPQLKDNYKRSPLEKAILTAYQDVHKAKQMINLLLASGVEINRYNRHLETPLLLAIRENISADIARLLLAKGATPNVHDQFHNAPLLEASQQAKIETVTALLGAGATINQQNLYDENALHLSLAPLWVQDGNSPGAETVLLKTTMRKLLDSSLHWADQSPQQIAKLKKQATKRYSKVANLLIQQGIRTDTKNYAGHTPLSLAVRANDLTITQHLLAKPARQTGRSDIAMQALLVYAFEHQFLALSELLFNYYPASLSDKAGRKLLYAASNNSEQFTPMIKRLLEQGAKQHLTDPEFSVLILTVAAENDAVATLRLLKEEYALNLLKKFYYRGSGQQNLLFVAVRNTGTKAIDFLLKAGVPINNTDARRDSVLSVATKLGNYQTVKLLLENQADANIQNNEGYAPLDLVRQRNEDDNTPLRITRLLLQYGATLEMAKNPLVMALKDYNQALALYYIDTLKQDISKPIKGESVLHIALDFMPDDGSKAYQKRLQLLRALLERGADVNLASSANRPEIKYPLERVFDHPKIMQLLLKYGAKVDSVNQQEQGLIQLLVKKSVHKRSIDSLGLLIQAGAEVDKQDKDGNTALHSLFSDSVYDAKQEQILLQKLQILLQHGQSANIKNNNGDTPFTKGLTVYRDITSLILALIPHITPIESQATDTASRPPVLHACKKVKILAALLKQGADINSTNSQGQTCLHSLMQFPYGAEDTGQLQAIQFALNQGININQQDKNGNSALHLLVDNYSSYASDERKKKYYAMIKLLLQNKSRLELRNSPENGSKTPLLLARNATVLQLLLHHGADLNAQDNQGNTLLHTTNDSKIFNLLVEKGINLELANQQKETVLFSAVQRDNKELIEYLLAHKAKTDVTNNSGNNLLHVVKSVAVAKQLMVLGVDVNHANKQGNTPLHVANSVEMTTGLLQNGANPDAQNQHGQTALHLASKQLRTADIANLLIDNKANITIKDHYGETALFKTAYSNQRKLAKRLVEKGADITLSNQLGDTPLHIALAVNSRQVAEFFIVNTTGNLNQSNWEQKTPLEFSLNHDGFGMSKLLTAKGATPSAASEQLAKIQEGNPFWLQRALKADLPEVAAQFLIPAENISHSEIKRRVTLREYGTNRTNLQMAAALGAEKLIAPMLAHGAVINAVNSKAQTALLLAVKNKHIETATRLMQQGANPTMIDDDGNTILHLAAQIQQPAMLEMLLSLNNNMVNVNALNKAGNTPLMVAAEQADIDSVKVLLRHKVDVNLANSQQMTSLLIAAKQINEELMRLLLAHKADVQAIDKQGNTALLLMLQQHIYQNIPVTNGISHKKILRLMNTLLHYGASLETTAENGRTALHMAVPVWEIAHFLLDKGSNIHALDKEENTPLLHSARATHSSSKSAELTARLLTMGSDIKHTNIWGETALHKAIRAENIPAINLLIDQGADVNATNNGGYTALLNVVHSGLLSTRQKIELVSKLLAKKADINATDKQQNTPLHIVLMDHNYALAQFLVTNNADINLQNNHDQSALHLLANHKSGSETEQLIQQLIQQQANLNQRDGNSNTPLHLAVIALQTQTVQQLVDNNAKVNLSNISGNMPLHLAAKQRSPEITKILLESQAKINAKNNLGDTPMHIAIRRKHDVVYRILAEAKNANPDSINYAGETPRGMLIKRLSK